MSPINYIKMVKAFYDFVHLNHDDVGNSIIFPLIVISKTFQK